MTTDHSNYVLSHSATVPNSYTSNTYPYVTSSYFKPDYVNFLANVSTECEPSTYDQAKKDSRWIQAMEQEPEALERNKTWEMIELPPGK